MTALPLTESNVVADLRAAHEELSHRFYDPHLAHILYDRDHAVAVARWYISDVEPAAELTPTPEAVDVYRALSSAIYEQYHFLTSEVGIRVNFTVEDPYNMSAEMFADVSATRSIKVYKTPDNAHPIWSAKENDYFRAVHDLLGHATWGNTFGPKGEDAAYRSHIATLPPEVWPALCTETRGQNATFNYGHLVDGRPPKRYARQSWLPAPEWVYRWNT